MSLKVILLIISVALIHAKFYSLDKDFNIQGYDHEISNLLDVDNSMVAITNYTDGRNTTGWVYYFVNASGNYPDWLQSYAIGYLEGYLAYDLVWYVWHNQYLKYLTDVPKGTWEWVHNQTKWIEKQISQNPKDHYWDLVNTTLAQLHGLYAGFMIASVRHLRTDFALSFDQFYTITYLSDLFDVMALYSEGHVNQEPLRCSYLLRLTENELYSSHDTWYAYIGLLKIYKMQNFNFSNPIVTTKSIAYSSQPGSVPSQDDFYIMDNNVTVAETSLESNNSNVYSYLHFDSVPYWIRITVANLAYVNQSQWTETYFNFRSGTYNNQWLIVDYKQYFKALSEGNTNFTNIVWMVEEFYSMTSQNDLTPMLLEQGYVASYNVPYNETISNYAQNAENYTTAPRYFLFKKYAPNIDTLELMQFVMRLNNYTDTENYSEAIAARGDLRPTANFPHGAVDCKIASATLIGSKGANIILSPTTELGLPAFNWSTWPQFVNYSWGMVESYNFDWVKVVNEQNYFIEDVFVY